MIDHSDLIDERKSLLALDGNRTLLIELAKMFCEDAPQILRSLKQAIADYNAGQARILAHNLKGLVSTFYALSTAELAQRFENTCASGQLDSIQAAEFERLELSVESIIADFHSRGWVLDNASQCK